VAPGEPCLELKVGAGGERGDQVVVLEDHTDLFAAEFGAGIFRQRIGVNAIHKHLPAVGSAAPDFLLIGTDLGEKRLGDFEGKKKILTINPSYDTAVCQAAARAFNQRAGSSDDVVVLVVSADLPFAQKRFCVAEGLEGVVPLSTFRGSFLRDYGVEVSESQANFVCADFGDRANDVEQRLTSQQIRVRRFAHRPEIANSLRITLPGDPNQFTILLAGLRKSLDPDARVEELV